MTTVCPLLVSSQLLCTLHRLFSFRELLDPSVCSAHYRVFHRLPCSNIPLTTSHLFFFLALFTPFGCLFFQLRCFFRSYVCTYFTRPFHKWNFSETTSRVSRVNPLVSFSLDPVITGLNYLLAVPVLFHNEIVGLVQYLYWSGCKS